MCIGYFLQWHDVNQNSFAAKFAVALKSALAVLLMVVLAATSALAQEIVKGVHWKPLRAVTTQGKSLDLYQQSHALLIGVSDYNNGWSKLPAIPEELDQLEQELIRKQFNVVRLNNPDARELKQGINDFINQYGYEPENRLLFFFSGHGHSQSNKGFLVPANAPLPDNRSVFRRRALSMNQFMAWARDIEAKHVLFLFDSCFSGSVFKSKNLPGESERYIRSATTMPVRQFITAGSADEVVPARSTFTPALVDALRGHGDLNKDGYITGSELGVHLSQLVPRFVDQTPQYGKIKDYHLAQGDFVFFNDSNTDSNASSQEPVSNPRPQAPAESSSGTENLLWTSAERGSTVAEYQAYLQQYPNGVFSGIARARIEQLQRSVPKPEPQPATVELTNAPQVTTEPVVTDTAVTATAITEPAGKEPTIEKEESVTSPDWELAQNSGTIGALKQYLAACKGTCEHQSVAESSLQRIQQQQAAFIVHVRNAELTSGTDGTALESIRAIEGLVPNEPWAEDARRQVADRYVQLAQRQQRAGKLQSAKRLVVKGLSVARIQSLENLSQQINQQLADKQQTVRAALPSADESIVTLQEIAEPTTEPQLVPQPVSTASPREIVYGADCAKRSIFTKTSTTTKITDRRKVADSRGARFPFGSLSKIDVSKGKKYYIYTTWKNLRRKKYEFHYSLYDPANNSVIYRNPYHIDVQDQGTTYTTWHTWTPSSNTPTGKYTYVLCEGGARHVMTFEVVR